MLYYCYFISTGVEYIVTMILLEILLVCGNICVTFTWQMDYYYLFTFRIEDRNNINTVFSIT